MTRHFIFASLIAAGAIIHFAAAPVFADADRVLGAKEEHDKAAVIIRQRRDGVEPDDVVVLAGREKMDSIVGLALGICLEANAKMAPDAAARAVAAVARRRDMHGFAAAAAAMSKHALPICETLIEDGKGASAAQQLAAGILAHYARIGSMPPARFPAQEMNGADAPEAGNNAKKNNAAARRAQRALTIVRPNKAAVAKLLEHLLNNRSADVLEPALLAAAYLEIKEVKPLTEKLVNHVSTEVRAATMLYLAKIGEAPPRDAMDRIFASQVKAPAQYTKLSPALSNYDVTISAHAYICEAVAAMGKPGEAGVPGAPGAPGEAGGAEYLDALHRMLKARDLRVQIEAAKALEVIASSDSVQPLVFELRKCEWPVLVSVASALGAIGEPAAVEPLITRLEDETGRFRLDLVYALSSIAGKQEARDAEGWRQWWDANRETFKPDAARTAAFRKQKRVQDMALPYLGFFYEAPIYSDRVVFTVDTSKSMSGQKFEDLKANMVETLENLKKHVRFNVADFGGHVRVMIPGRMMNASAGAAAAIQQLGYMELTLGTRSYDGIEAAVALPTMDTIYFLSDGAPIASKLNAWGRIIAGLHLLNRYRPVAVFTIEFNANPGNLAALREMAARFYGRSSSPNAQ